MLVQAVNFLERSPGTNPTLLTLRRLAVALRCNVGDLVDGLPDE